MSVLLLGLSLGGSACGSFDGALRNFDTIAGVGAESPDPVMLNYPSNVRAWLLASGKTGADRVPPSALESPSAFARAQLLQMVRRASGSIVETGITAQRLLLVLERDVNALNRIEAIDGLADLLSALEIELLPRLAPRESEQIVARTESVLAGLAEWASADFETWDSPSAGSPEDTRIREACALAASSGSLASFADDRRVLRVLSDLAAAVESRELSEFVHSALAEVLANASARAFWDSCRSAPDPRLRESATLAIYRSVGPRSLPVLLGLLSRSDGARYRYPLTIRERRTLLRLCAHARGELLYERFLGRGPRIIDFVYDTVSVPEGVRDGEALQLLALETLSRCLGRQISLDRTWADTWWRELALRGETSEEPSSSDVEDSSGEGSPESRLPRSTSEGAPGGGN